MRLDQLPAEIKRLVPTAFTAKNYESAKIALRECVRVDECKSIDDKAAAVAAYAKQIRDKSMEDLAKRIRLRAQRRLGEILSELENEHERGVALDKADVSVNVGIRSLRLANIPKDKFERSIEVTPVPSSHALAYGPRYGVPSKPRTEQAHKFTNVLNSLLAFCRTHDARDLVIDLCGASPQSGSQERDIDAFIAIRTRDQVIEAMEWCDLLAQLLEKRRLGKL